MIFTKSKKIRVRVAAIIRREDRLLFVAHKKNNDVYWLLPGGGVDFGETLVNALQREITEEVSLSIEPRELVMVIDSIDPDRGRHIINAIFTCTDPVGDPRLGRDKRLYECAFFDKHEIKNLTVFPPINAELIRILENKKYTTSLYQEKKWILL